MNAGEHRINARSGDYPAINISRIRIGGDAGGLIFVVGMVVCLLLGVPQTRGFFAETLAGGLVVAGVIAWWHRRPRSPRGAPVSLGLRDR